MKSVSRPRAEAFRLQGSTEEFQYLTRRYKRGKTAEKVRVHSWEHSYPHSKRKKGFDNYIEINGQGRTWSSLEKLEKDVGSNYVLLYQGCLGVYEEVGSEPIDCS